MLTFFGGVLVIGTMAAIVLIAIVSLANMTDEKISNGWEDEEVDFNSPACRASRWGGGSEHRADDKNGSSKSFPPIEKSHKK